MAEKLTAQQKTAVTDRGGNLLVSAAAGSGKTKVLVDRLLGYLTDPTAPANVDDFLIITYTKAAAAELRGKIAQKLTEAVAVDPENRHLQQQLQRIYLTKISTVHSFCGDILREYAYRLDIPSDFRVADETECLDLQYKVLEQLLNEVYEEQELDPGFRAFVDSQGFGRDDRGIPELIQKVYNSARCHLEPEKWLDGCLTNEVCRGIDDAAGTPWGQYLIEQLKAFVASQIIALNICAQRASGIEAMEKPVLLLKETVVQLQQIIECDTWDSIRSRLAVDFGRLVFSKKCGDPELAEQIKAVRSACKKGLERHARRFSNTSEQILLDQNSVEAAAGGLIDLVKAFGVAYEKLKKSRRILDFSDLEHKTLDLFRGKRRGAPTVTAREVGSRFREIMVDEYQDSNAVQDSIFKAITDKRNNCFMVGDVKQSIYQFRLADPGIFLDKYSTFLPAGDAKAGEDRKVLLSHNFRSSGGIISGVNDVFSTCMSPEVGGLNYGKEELLYEGIPHVPLEAPEVELYGICVKESSYHEEAAFAAQRIAELLDGKHMIRSGDTLRPVTPGDIVILLRSPGSIGSYFCAALERQNIPCTMGGNVDLLRTEEVAALHALLQVIDNPLQDIPLLTALSGRIFCFTADELAQFRKADRRAPLYNAMKEFHSSKVQSFLELLEQLRNRSRMSKLTELIAYVFAKTRMESIFASLPDGAARVENLQAFCQLAAGYEAGGISDLSRFLEQLEAVAQRGLAVPGKDAAPAAVTVMSIHKSKGLEFPVVFLCGLSREFNRESARATVLCDKELGLGLCCVDRERRIRYPSLAKTAIAAKMNRDSVSEELRVLYVAMTRARDRLIMTYASGNLEEELRDLAARRDICGARYMASEVNCPGKWVLLTALGRTEAGELFKLCGKSYTARVSDHPWRIRVIEVTEAPAAAQTAEEAVGISQETVEKIRAGLAFRYPYLPSTVTPSKQTATQLKGRVKDQEAAAGADVKSQIRFWRKPSFEEKITDGRAYGNAIHSVMQYIRYDACGSREAVSGEIARLVKEEYISQECGELADSGRIAAFFETELGKKLRESRNVLREFKFSILDEGEKYTDGLYGEKVLLQGVVDCALLERDGITVLDFKTDSVKDGCTAPLTEKYAAQVQAYADALARIYRMPIKEKLIYYFSVGKFDKVP